MSGSVNAMLECIFNECDQEQSRYAVVPVYNTLLLKGDFTADRAANGFELHVLMKTGKLLFQFNKFLACVKQGEP